MFPFVVDLSLRITVAAGLVGLVLALLRVRSAAARHAAWTAVLLTMVAMPVLAAIVPRIPVPVPFHLRTNPGAVAVQLDEVLLPPSPRFDDSTAAMVSVAPAPDVEPRQPSQLPAVTRTTSMDWLTLGLALYLVGVATLSVRLVIGWRMARGLVRSATRLDLTAVAPVFESAAVAAPLTTGVVRPSIVLPGDWRRWPADTLRAVLAHENAHVRRRDLAVQFLARVNRALFWFHPLAWWLERQLAISSEQACDDAVVRSGGEPRRYAEILLGIAEAVSHRGQRIAWTAVGIDGSGLLGARIDRVLRGDAAHRRMSVLRRASVAAGCAVVLVVAVACRTESAAPLTPDASVALRLEMEKLRTRQFETARDLPLDQVDALEARIERDPNDWEAREQLVTYYSAGTAVPWNRKVPGLRRHALWLIEHHPEHDVAPPALSPEYDPQGFAEAIRLWESHLEKANASPYLVYRAARFFVPHDKPRAEQLMLRGLAMDPQSEALKAHMPENVGGYQWPSQLAMLYASALLGSEHYGYPTYNAERARSPFAMSVRQKLAGSTDARLLVQVGQYLSRRGRPGAGAEEIRALGDAYLRRAVQIDPDLTLARAALVGLRSRERHERMYEARRNNAPVSEEDRLAYLAEQAMSRVVAADSANYYKNDQAAARTAQQNAVEHAREALALAAQRPHDAAYSSSVTNAHFVLATEAIRSGDRDEAIDHLMAATEVPANDDIVYSQAAGWLRPVNYLLKAGERERVITFLEAFARLNIVQRERLLEDANDIREGRMPSAYQHMLAREAAPGVDPNPR
jgi:beta-lactamase regulating signal transducer with metallopeptidase domain